jgi:hypothetical protein
VLEHARHLSRLGTDRETDCWPRCIPHRGNARLHAADGAGGRLCGEAILTDLDRSSAQFSAKMKAKLNRTGEL